MYKSKNLSRAPQPRTAVRVAQTAYKALKIANNVRSMVNVEKKKSDNTYSSNNTWNGDMITLNNIAQGDSNNERIGDSMVVKSIKVHGIHVRSAADCAVRVILLLDKQNCVTTLQDVLVLVGQQYSPFSGYNHDNDRRFRILSDKTYELNSNSPQKVFKISATNLKTHTRYDNGATTINSGAYKMIILSNKSSGGPLTTMFTRLEYIDN